MAERESLLLDTLRERAEHLKCLPEGWDTYSGDRINAKAADKAVEVAIALAPLFPSYEPQLVPCSDGSVQVEIHSDSYDIEACVTSV